MEKEVMEEKLTKEFQHLLGMRLAINKAEGILCSSEYADVLSQESFDILYSQIKWRDAWLSGTFWGWISAIETLGVDFDYNSVEAEMVDEDELLYWEKEFSRYVPKDVVFDFA